jgi:hypothetical protein
MVDEILSGNLNAVVRLDNHVHRPTGSWTPAVHCLLNHLKTKRLEGIPEVIGFDKQGREVLTFIEGESGANIPGWVFEPNTLMQVGSWLRNYHQAVADFQEPNGAAWRMCWAPMKTDEIICHFDVAPRNLVLQPSGKIAVIDFEAAAPGDARLELGKVCNNFLAFSDQGDSVALHESVQRTRILCQSYGWKDKKLIVPWMIKAASHSYQRIERAALEGDKALKTLLISGKVDHLLTIRNWLQAHKQAFERALSGALK